MANKFFPSKYSNQVIVIKVQDILSYDVFRVHKLFIMFQYLTNHF